MRGTPHLVQILACLVLVSGPLPVALRFAALRRHGSSAAPRAHAVLSTLTAWCVLEIAIAVVLGATHRFELRTLMTAEAVLGVAGGAMAIEGRRRSDLVAASGTPWSAPELALAAAWGVAAVALLLTLWLEPITESDSLSYHLPAMAAWYQTHSFVLPGGIMPAETGYPYDWEALCGLFLLPFGSDFVVALPNLIAWVVLGVGTYGTAVVLGARRVHALAAMVLMGNLPVVRDVLPTMHVDLPLAAFFLAGVFFAVAGDLPSFVAAVGLVLGIKLTGLVYAVLLLAVGVVTGKRSSRPPAAGSRRDRLVAGVVVLAAAIAATFWYVRNLVAGGNPIGVVRIELGGHTIFPGVVDAVGYRETTLLHQFSPTSPAHWHVVLGMLWNRGRLALAVLAVAAAGALGRRPSDTRRARIAVAALLVATSAIYLVTPFSGGRRIAPWIGENFRYGLSALAVLAVLAALGMPRLRLPDGLLAATAILAGPARASRRTLAAAILFAAGLWSIHAATRRTTRRRLAIGLATAACVMVVGTSELRRVHADRKRARYGPVYTSESGVITARETIGYVASHAKYVFYGPDLERPVRYVPPATGSRNEWLADLDRLGVDVVAVGPIERRKWSHRAERAWLDDPSGPFVRILGREPTREIVLYRRHPTGSVETAR